MEDEDTAKVLVVDTPAKDDSHIGIGYHGAGSSVAAETALDRTYLIATVWGYSNNVDKDKRQTPEVSLNCLSPGSQFDSPPTNGATTMTSTMATTVASSTSTSGANKRFAAVRMPGLSALKHVFGSGVPSIKKTQSGHMGC